MVAKCIQLDSKCPYPYWSIEKGAHLGAFQPNDEICLLRLVDSHSAGTVRVILWDDLWICNDIVVMSSECTPLK